MANKVDTRKQKEIDSIITLRNKEIRNVLSGKPRITAAAKTGPTSTSMKALVASAPILFIGTIWVFHGVLSIGSTTNTMSQYSYRLVLFSIIYGAIAIGLHALLLSLTVDKHNVVTALSSLVPVIATLLLLRSYPEMTAPIDNTLGYSITKATTSSDNNPMSKFGSTLFPIETLNKLGENVRIPFDWLLTTFELNNIESILEKLKSKVDVSNLPSQSGIVPDFYIDLNKGTTEYDVFKKQLIDMIKAKHSAGHLIVTLIACTAGIAMSLAISMNAK
jgi:hypothetical protein